MQWIKTHLNIVITIALGVVGITGLVLGIVLSDVASAMQQDQSTLTSLTSTKGSNEGAIEQARKHADDVSKQLGQALKDFESVGNHTPLMDKIFPQVDKVDTAAPFHFKPRYLDAIKQLLAKLKATDQPSQEDFRREQLAIDDAKLKAAREQLIGVDPRTAKSRPAGTRAVVTPLAQPTKAGPKTLPTPEELARDNPQVRASIRKARAGYCYASLGDKTTSPSPPTFMMPELLSKDDSPSVEAMWYAQMMLWIEQDVVNTIVAINQAAAEKLPEKDRWVGNLPIKHLVRIAVGSYVPAVSGQGGGRGGAAPTAGGPPNDGNSVFTVRGSSSGVDVVQFGLDLYLNPQYLPALINAISKVGFYTPLLVNYDAYSPATEWVGFVYGADPVIHANLLFEGCFLRAKYEKWMPESVKTAITEGRAGMGGTGSHVPMGGSGGGGRPGGAGESFPRGS